MFTQLIDGFTVDSGQFCVISEDALGDFNQNEEWVEFRRIFHKPSGQPIDTKFLQNWMAVVPEYDKNLNELEKSGELEIKITEHNPVLDYNSMSYLTLYAPLQAGIIEQNNKKVAFVSSTLHGDGNYPIFSNTENDGSSTFLALTGYPRHQEEKLEAESEDGWITFPDKFEKLIDIGISEDHFVDAGEIEASGLAFTDPGYIKNGDFKIGAKFDSKGIFKVTLLKEKEEYPPYGLILKKA